jgi:hypothetical protein
MLYNIKIEMNLIWTNFYTDLLPTSANCKAYLERNYTEYTLFSFQNWLYPEIKDEIDAYILNFLELPKNNKRYLAIQFMSDDQELQLDNTFKEKLQAKIYEFSILNEKFVYIFYYDQEIYTEEGERIPKIWVNQVLEYINLDPSYQLHIGKHGLLGNIKDYHDYVDIITKLQVTIQNVLISHFKMGVIVNPPEDVVNSWELENISDRLYRMKQVDSRLFSRYSYVSNFLINLVLGNNVIYLKFPKDFLYRHLFAHQVQSMGIYNFTFTDDGVDIELNTLSNAIQVLNIMDLIIIEEPESSGLSFLYLISQDEIKITNNSEVIYKVSDMERPYVYSKLN